jgi:hypothetical protein
MKQEINMGSSGSSINNNTLTHSSNNSDISIIAVGTGITNFDTNETTRLSITSTGDINFNTIPNSTAIPSPLPSNNLLNGNYFTYTSYNPTVNVPSNDAIISYVVQQGYFCQFGNLVFFTACVRVGSVSFPTAGELRYTLPIACTNSGYNQSLNTGFHGFWSGPYINMTSFIPDVLNASYFQLRRKIISSASTSVVMTSDNCPPNSLVAVSGVYALN